MGGEKAQEYPWQFFSTLFDLGITKLAIPQETKPYANFHVHVDVAGLLKTSSLRIIHAMWAYQHIFYDEVFPKWYSEDKFEKYHNKPTKGGHDKKGQWTYSTRSIDYKRGERSVLRTIEEQQVPVHKWMG